MCPSSGEITVSMRYLVLWLSGMQGGPFHPAYQSSTQSDKYHCRIDTIISPDDGHIVAQNM